ncbi:MAG: alpha/beta hydrolase fold domain-containing protein [Sedimentisphaerales bacterium]|nr:alpha/beta hydrolase fold domain-containing protein [Sedimentisphaerales bacterium]
MLKNRILRISLATCTAAFLLLTSPAPAQDNNDLPKVLIIGDSISLGYTNDVAQLLSGKADVSRPQKPQGKPINCGSTAMGLENLDNWLGNTKWDVIHFNWGLWDLCYRLPDSPNLAKDKVNGKLTTTLDQYEQNISKLVKKLKTTGAKLIWANTTPVPEDEVGRIQGDAIKYNAVAAKVMQQNHIAINDLHAYITAAGQKYYIQPGNVHFTKEGYRYLAEKVATIIEASLGPVEIELWPKGTPGSLGTEPKDKPTMTMYLPLAGNAIRAAVVVLPGGGYHNLAEDHEGVQIANWLNSFGTAAFVVHYRHAGKGYGYPAPQDDAQRAMRIVRSRAVECDLDANKIGVMGFSAGGHLASTVTTLFDKGYGMSGDDVDKVSSRPDFSILCYPVITMSEWFTHQGSKNNLLGEHPDADLEKLMSTDLQVTDKTPPVFLVHADDDRAVWPDNSIAFYMALRKAKVEAELHIYKKGRHGFGLGQGKGPVEGWPDVCRDWLLATIAE